MEVHNEATDGLKVSLMVFGALLMVTLTLFVSVSNKQIGAIYTEVSESQLTLVDAY